MSSFQESFICGTPSYPAWGLGLFRVLHFFCQTSQGYCQPGTTLCVKFLGWRFSDHVVVQFRSQVSLQKGLWLHILEEIVSCSQFRAFLSSLCANWLIFVLSALSLRIHALYWCSVPIPCFRVSPRTINSPFPGQLERLDLTYYSFLVPPNIFCLWDLPCFLASSDV